MTASWYKNRIYIIIQIVLLTKLYIQVINLNFPTICPKIESTSSRKEIMHVDPGRINKAETMYVGVVNLIYPTPHSIHILKLNMMGRNLRVH